MIARVLFAVLLVAMGGGIGLALLWLRMIAFGRERPGDCVVCAWLPGLQHPAPTCGIVVQTVHMFVDADDHWTSAPPFLHGFLAACCGAMVGGILLWGVVRRALRGGGPR